MVNATKGHDSRHDAVVEHRRGFGIVASGVVDDVSVTSEAAPGKQEFDIVHRECVGKCATFFAINTVSPSERRVSGIRVGFRRLPKHVISGSR